MAQSAADRERMLRRRRQHERQAVVFGSLIALLAIAMLGSAAVYTGALTVPFLDREFSSPPPEEQASIPAAPCPPEGTLPVAYNTIQVTVLNATNQTGLAGLTGTSLTERGFAVLTTGDYPGEPLAPTQISFGQAGLAAAYTLAANVEAPVLVLDTRAEATVDLILGPEFPGLLDVATVVLDPAAPLPPPPGCVPLDVALADAVPPPVATEAPTEAATEPATEPAAPAAP